MARSYMSSSEAANRVIHAAVLTHGNNIFVLKVDEVVKIDELAKHMIRLLGLRLHVDIKIEYTGRLGENCTKSFMMYYSLPTSRLPCPQTLC
jgi:FlaA1/EpsC-like NDP-sugar epimerase